MRKRKLLRALLIGLSSSIIITIISHIGYLEFLQRKSIDFMVWWKDEEKASDIAIVAIDNEAYEYLGKKTPLPRDKLAILIDFLIRCKARVISVDVEFRDKTSPEKDELLISVLDSGKMVTPYSIMPSEIPGRYKRLPLFYAFKDTLIGYANVYTDDDGLIRRSPLTLRDEENNPMRSFGLQTYLRYSGNSGNREYLSETRDSGIIRINYSGPAGTFPHYPARPFLMMAEAGLEPPSENPFSDKLVFIGATFGDSRDFFLTPNGPMSGVEIHANIVNTLLTAKEIRTLTWPLMFLIQFTLCMIVSVLFAFLRVWKTIIISVSGLVLIFIPLSYLAYVSRNYWIDFTLPFAAIMMISVTNNYLEKRRLRRSFSQYVSKEVVDRIYEDERALLGQRRVATILFSDLRGFTSFSENLPVEELIDVLNQYFNLMTGIILKNRGMLNKFIGDAIMAIYNVPVNDPHHAPHAVITAMEMKKELEQLNSVLSAKGKGDLQLQMGIGIHTGEVFAGNVGARQRKEYTVMGDAVNLASRIEQLNKEFLTSILISEETYKLVKDYVDVLDKGLVEIRGRKHGVRVFELKKAGGES